MIKIEGFYDENNLLFETRVIEKIKTF